MDGSSQAPFNVKFSIRGLSSVFAVTSCFEIFTFHKFHAVEQLESFRGVARHEMPLLELTQCCDAFV